MTQDRPEIPAELRRAVLVEAGHRCAIPTCRQHPLDIAHIVDWAQCKEHKFENLIALCVLCHRRFDNRKEIDRKAMRQYKANLALINARYGDVERLLLEWFAADLESHSTAGVARGTEWMFYNLTRDGLIAISEIEPTWAEVAAGRSVNEIALTERGRAVVANFAQPRPLDE